MQLLLCGIKKEGERNNDYQRLYLHCIFDVRSRRFAVPAEEHQVENL
jgi:hypothetical protein